MTDVIRVVLVDDHAVLRGGLRALIDLEPDLEVIGEASSGEEGFDRIRLTSPDVAVMDLDMPGAGGLATIRRLAEAGSRTRVLVLTSQPEDQYLLPVLEAGGSGYVHKSSAEQDVIEAIRTVARDEVFLYPRAAKMLLQGFRRAEENGEISPLEELSAREREVLTLAAEGFSSAEIGKKLFLSPKTVDTYRYRLMRKLGISHRSELVRFALGAGLLKAKGEE
ncbi:MAG: response regulator transcription factor [Gemmatimonadota bacterium]|jgi:two-component system response regulator NreC|nr:response regulator transcription factor [Gemmatimonadota bacterium]